MLKEVQMDAGGMLKTNYCLSEKPAVIEGDETQKSFNWA